MPQLQSSLQDTPSSARPLPTRPRTFLNAVKDVWHLLIFRDHWQGEFAVALFGAVGWGLLSIVIPGKTTGLPQFRLLAQFFPDEWWEVIFMTAGFVQLYGLRTSSSWCRAIGATVVMMCFVCAVASVLVDGPHTPGIATYFVCISIELCAIIYQTARIIRLREYPKWRWIGK